MMGSRRSRGADSTQAHKAARMLVRLGLILALLVPFPLLAVTGSVTAKRKPPKAVVHPGPVEVTGSAGAPQHEPKNVKVKGDAAPKIAAAPAHLTDPVDMRLLLLAADGQETDYAALRAFLDQLGIPYDVLLATTSDLTRDRLWDGVSHGYYQGIVLTTGNLTYFDQAAGDWRSALTDAEWSVLWDYEAQFGIRQVTSYTYPEGLPDDYGLDLVTYQDTSITPLEATLTPAGQSLFSYLRPAAPITFRHAWVYLATVEDPAVTTPLIVTPGGHAIASITRYPDGRQNLAVTAANNWFIRHSQLLSYGLVNWVTKGLFLGERHVNLDVQVDDLLIDSEIWDPVANSDQTGLTYRMNGTDYLRAISWQAAARSRDPGFAGLKLEMAFNGEGATGIYSPDTLTPYVRLLNSPFNWINHTFTHINLDASDYATSMDELTQNDAMSRQLRLRSYRREAMVQPDISGLANPLFQQAAFDFGIRYLISDTSRPEWNNPTPNAGFYSTLQPEILIIPRRPTNLFYNLSTPEEWVDEYNYYYGPGGVWAYWPRDQTYDEILDHESENLLSYMLRWDLDPWMFHQANLRAYSGGRSVLGDLLNLTLDKYRAAYTLPVRNLSEYEAGQRMAQRMSFNGSGVRGVLTPCTSMTLTTSSQAVIPVTGVATGSSETYGGQPISYVPAAPGAPVSIPLPGC
jgi:hypothetical protein